MKTRGEVDEQHPRFRPSARLVAVLGEHLISDQAIGLIELVKNAYDADATEVEIELRGLVAPDTTTVIVRDNGVGMTRADINGKWLVPAADHKERDKTQNRRTPLGRLPLGEKGVGRFAAHQIGRDLELVTRAQRAPEVVVPIQWDSFEGDGVYLDDLPVRVIEREPELFKGAATGTSITIRRARAPWTRQLLEKVHRTLRRLQSPLRDTETRFRVTLKCPEFPDFENIDATDILEHAHYEFQALVEADGQCDFEYHCRHPMLSCRDKSGSENLVALAARELQSKEPQCGPFWLNLYVWDRTKDYLAQAGISARELTAQSGVSLFRDGLRVLPYGEPGDDWLLLDQERIQDPSGRIGNNQVIGLVQLLQERNLRLRDKTNREGLIENEAFLDLKAMTRAAMRLFISFWKKDRPRDTDPLTTKPGSLVVAKGVAAALKKTASDHVAVEIRPSVAEMDGRSSAAVSVPGITTTVTQREAVDILIENIDGASRSAAETEKRIDRLLSLAATGLAAERVVHEFGRQVSAALEALAALRRGRRGGARDDAAFDVLDACLGTLRNEFRILSPYESVDRIQKKRAVSPREAIGLTLTINKRPIEDAGIDVTVDGEDFEIAGRPAGVVQVLDNLVHNACFWLATLKPGRERRLIVRLDPKQRRVLVADSGPGIHEEARAHLFEPFFSLKAGGTGLGLYISREVRRRAGGTVGVATPEQTRGLPSWARGAAFAIDFTADAVAR
jgi:signal transduction histidine kinase